MSTDLQAKVEDILKHSELLDRFDDSDRNVVAKKRRSLIYPQSEEEFTFQSSDEQLKFLVAALVELLCYYSGRDRKNCHRLFLVLSQTLVRLKLIPPLFFSDDLHSVRDQFRFAFLHLLQKAKTYCDHPLLEQKAIDGEETSSSESSADKEQDISTSSLPDQLQHLSSPPPPHHSSSERFVFSRYSDEFIELERIGKGGFGTVFKVKNKLDDQMYAVKRIKFSVEDGAECFKSLREVRLLARLNHPNVVRYYSSWLELDSGFFQADIPESLVDKGQPPDRSSTFHLKDDYEVDDSDELADLKRSFSSPEISFESSHVTTSEDRGSRSQQRVSEYTGTAKATANSASLKKLLQKSGNVHQLIAYRRCSRLQSSIVLCVQMELFPLSLDVWLAKRNAVHAADDVSLLVNSGTNKTILEQMLEALDYIHSQNLIHRDIKPRNVFLKGDRPHVVVADFGLACSSWDNDFIRGADETLSSVTLERRSSSGGDDQDSTHASPQMVHSRGVGTVIYAAPEQLESSVYSDKVDMYSIGIIAYELYYPFKTSMERYDVLLKLRNHSIIPEAFQQRWPVESGIISQLTQFNPLLRPTARQLLESKLFSVETAAMNLLISERDELRAEVQRLQQLMKKMGPRDDASQR